MLKLKFIFLLAFIVYLHTLTSKGDDKWDNAYKDAATRQVPIMSLVCMEGCGPCERIKSQYTGWFQQHGSYIHYMNTEQGCPFHPSCFPTLYVSYDKQTFCYSDANHIADFVNSYKGK